MTDITKKSLWQLHIFFYFLFPYYLIKILLITIFIKHIEIYYQLHTSIIIFAENDSGVAFSNSTNPESCTFKEKVQEAEIRIATFFLEHDISFAISSEFIGLFQDMDPLVLKSVKLASSKISSISNNVVCAAETKEITEILQKESFSVCEDETNDRTQEKWLLLVVRYIQPVWLQLRVELHQLVN